MTRETVSRTSSSSSLTSPPIRSSTALAVSSPMKEVICRWASWRLISTRETSRPDASAMAATWRRTVTRSGPVRAYVRPRWPGSVSAVRATAAMSAGWMVGSPTSTYGARTTPCSRIDGAHHRVLEANCVGLRTVQAMPLPSRRRSTARFSRAAGRCGWVSTVIEDTSTTCSTPACRAASRTSASAPVPDSRNSERAPSNASFSESARARSPSTTSIPSGNEARPASRVRPRTGPASLRRSCRSRALPMFPVAPVTRIIVVSSCPGRVITYAAR
ncbi:hypothetical protein SNL152K_2327 [Streptomyces sp. NL15-2K]|nr:hypothetical protein SNL152K_2327 [Streptomyces sp. NL15-2K]